MIVYFSGTGNSLATARKIAEATGDKVMELGASRSRNHGNTTIQM